MVSSTPVISDWISTISLSLVVRIRKSPETFKAPVPSAPALSVRLLSVWIIPSVPSPVCENVMSPAVVRVVAPPPNV